MPIKWVEDRMDNLMATAFARDYWMHGKISATKDGKRFNDPTSKIYTPKRLLLGIITALKGAVSYPYNFNFQFCTDESGSLKFFFR